MAVAVCVLIGAAAAVAGNLTLVQNNDDSIHISGDITGLTPGNHGFHVHQYGNTSNNCLAAGGHFNPHNNTHGSPCDENRHVGDLGNIEANADGTAIVNISDCIISFSGTNNILNRAIVVHAGEDDLGRGGDAGSLATGNAGARVACCVITVLPTH